MIKKSLKVLYYKFSNYHNEIREFNYNEFNKFIITVLLKQFTRTDIILPAAVGFITILTSIQVITQSYVFFPQSNITAYVTFLLFQFAISIGTMFILPLITIIVIKPCWSFCLFISVIIRIVLVKRKWHVLQKVEDCSNE